MSEPTKSTPRSDSKELNDKQACPQANASEMATASDFISQCIAHDDWEMAAEHVAAWGEACRAFIGATEEGARHWQELVSRYAMQVVKAARSHRGGDPESAPENWGEFLAATLGEPLLLEAIVHDIKRAEGGAGKLPIECDLKWIDAQLRALDASGERWGPGPNRDMEIRLIQRCAAIRVPESVIKTLQSHGVGQKLTPDEKRAVFENWAPKQGSGHPSDWEQGEEMKNSLGALESVGWIDRTDSLRAMAKIMENAAAISATHNARLETLGVAAAALLERDPFAARGDAAQWSLWIMQMKGLAERSQSAIGARRPTNWGRAMILGQALVEAAELEALAGLTRDRREGGEDDASAQPHLSTPPNLSSRRL